MQRVAQSRSIPVPHKSSSFVSLSETKQLLQSSFPINSWQMCQLRSHIKSLGVAGSVDEVLILAKFSTQMQEWMYDYFEPIMRKRTLA